MSTGLPVFDTTIQDSNLWLKRVEAHLGGAERQQAYSVLRAVLHALRDRLQPHAAVNFAAQLPMLLRGLYYEGWTMPDGPGDARTVREFADDVRIYLPPHFAFGATEASRAVFATIADMTAAGEAHKLISQLPPALHELWPPAARK